MELQFIVNNTILKRIDNERIKKSNRTPVECKFNFVDETWNDSEKFVIFKTDKGHAHREYLGVSGASFTIPVPHEVLKCNYFTVTVYANDSFLTNEAIVYFLDDVIHYNRGRVRNHRQHHRHEHEPGHEHKHDHWDPRFEKDIFVDIYEQIHSCFDAIEFHEQTLEFFANRELVYSVRIPFADETTVRAWMAEQDMKNIQIDQALENKADKIHTHKSSEITDLSENMGGSMDRLVIDLTGAILDL